MRDWLLTHAERANPATHLDDHGDPDTAWSDGNLVRPLIHGSVYFGELSAAIERTGRADTIMFVDWRGDPDEQLTGQLGSSIAERLCAAARRGVAVYGLVWRSHLDRFRFSEQENRHLGEEINAAGGCCLLDMRVRVGGSHHQKFILLRHAEHPEWDVAFLGGIDLCHGRRDDIEHDGDPQPQPMAAVYGSTPPWHDIQLEIRGPAIADVETVFRERWDDPRPLSRNPMHRIADRIRGGDEVKRPLPPSPARPAEVGAAHGATAAHLPAPLERIPVRAPGRAKHRAWLRQGASPSPAADLHRGSVPVVAGGGRPHRRNPTHERAAETDRGAAALSGPGRPDLAAPEPRRQGDRATADHRGRAEPRRRVRHRERGRDADLRARQGVHHRRRVGDDRLGQLQPALLDARLGVDRGSLGSTPSPTRTIAGTPPSTGRGPTLANFG